MLRPRHRGGRRGNSRIEQGAQAVSRETAGPLGVEGEEQAETAPPQALPPCQLRQEVPLAWEGGLGVRLHWAAG